MLPGVDPTDQSHGGTPACSCLSDIVSVVQKLDDDDFQLTKMPLDKVLHLQKWLIFQCCKPLDCFSCVGVPAVHTVLLIVCDRLAEMFECIHKRIKRAGASMSRRKDPNDPSDPSDLSDSHSADPPGVAAETSAQLFCSSSGLAVNSTSCNPMMFSDEFCDQYTDEEQMHMIRALLKLQIKYFYQLLSRIDGISQGQGNQARRSKIKSITGRLTKAAAAIDGGMRMVLQTWVVS